MDPAELLEIIYVSDINPDFTAQDLNTLHQQAHLNNLKNDVTGLLLVTDKHFMQLIEGTASAIKSLFTKLGADERHHNVRLISERPLANRQFPDWHMGLRYCLDQAESADIAAVINTYGTQQHFSAQHATAVGMLFRAI